MMGRLRDPREAAEWLQCSVSMVRKLSRIGQLETVLVGRLPRYTDAALEAYIERRTRRVASLAVPRGGRRP